jgi:hypothetical protein
VSLLDDARKLADEPPVTQDQTGEGHCAYCYGDYYIVDGAKVTRSDQIQHEPDCPWLSMPKIVAVLEAAYGWADGLPGNISREERLRTILRGEPS